MDLSRLADPQTLEELWKRTERIRSQVDFDELLGHLGLERKPSGGEKAWPVAGAFSAGVALGAGVGVVLLQLLRGEDEQPTEAPGSEKAPSTEVSHTRSRASAAKPAAKPVEKPAAKQASAKRSASSTSRSQSGSKSAATKKSSSRTGSTKKSATDGRGASARRKRDETKPN